MPFEVAFHSFQSPTVVVAHQEPLKAIPCKTSDASSKKKITEYTVKINGQKTHLVPLVLGYLEYPEAAKAQAVCSEWRQQIQELGVQRLVTEKYKFYRQVGDPKQKALQKARDYTQKPVNLLRCAQISSLCRALITY